MKSIRIQLLSLITLCSALGQLSAAPYGDNFNFPNWLIGDNDSQDDTTVGATYQAGEPNIFQQGGSIWFRWTAYNKGTAIFDATYGNTGGNWLEVYTGDTLASLVLLGKDYEFNRSRVTIPTSAYTVYYARVTSPYNSRVGPVTVAVSFARDATDDPVYGHFTKFPSFLPRRSIVARGYFTDPNRVKYLNCRYHGKIKISSFNFDHGTGAFKIVFAKKYRTRRVVRGGAVIQAISYNGVVIGDTISFRVNLR